MSEEQMRQLSPVKYGHYQKTVITVGINATLSKERVQKIGCHLLLATPFFCTYL